MIDFSQRTLANIKQEMLDQVEDKYDKREGSIIETAIGPAAWLTEGLFMDLSKLQDSSNPYTAVGEALDMLVALRGIVRKDATAAVREGIFDAAIPEESSFRTINGDRSVIFISGELISNENGVYTYKMTCQETGTIGNSYIGPIMPITAITDLSEANIGEIITEGTEEETDSALRNRFFATFDAQPYGGNIAQYRRSILEMNGVGAVQVYPVWNGGGTVLCSILNDNLKPASQTLISEVQNKVCPAEDGESAPSEKGYGIAPIGAVVTITTGTEFTLNISCTIQFQSGVENGSQIYGSDIEEAIEEYLASVRESWGQELQTHEISYPVSVYTARIIYAILSIPAVVNVSELLINGSSGDLIMTETAALQQVPVLGTVTINEE